jgi:hypothetical protein
MMMRALRRLLALTLIPALAACPAMTPDTFSAKDVGDVSTEPTPKEDESPFAPSLPSPGPADAAPSPLPSTPPSPPGTAPIGMSYFSPISPGPLAAADDPMGPRADKEGAGDCPSVYAATKGARVHYSDPEGSIASTDKTSPTPLDLTKSASLSGHFFLEALLPTGDISAESADDPSTGFWDDRAVGYVRVIVTPSGGIGATYVDLSLDDLAFDASFAAGPPDLHREAYNLVLPNIPVPTNASVELTYVHNIYKRVLISGDPMANSPWAACNVVIGQPPDHSGISAPYSGDVQANFEAFRAEGKAHTAAVFEISRYRFERALPWAIQMKRSSM